MKIPEQEILFMFEEGKNFSNEISNSDGQAILMGNNPPPVMLAAIPDASHNIPAEKPGSELIQEALSGDENNVDGNTPKRKRYHRYSEPQINVLEAFFKECPRPNHLERKELSHRLGIDPMKVKFWFQNKHTQLRLQFQHQKTIEYRAENEELLTENLKLKQALSVCTCQLCGGPLANRDMTSPGDLLKLENDKLREEINRISCIILKDGGNPRPSSAASIPSAVSNDD